MQEWSDAINPFNSLKALAHPDRFMKLAYGKIPAPVSVTVDPTNKCNLNCHFCHYASWLKESHVEASTNALINLARWLGGWQGLKVVCVAGGGEPMLHEAFPNFIRELLSSGLKVGVITNGTRMEGANLDVCRLCSWVGVSVDAGTEETYIKQKGSGYHSHMFEKVQANIYNLSKSKPCLPSIGYKFVMQPDTVGEICEAAGVAKSCGANDFHCRPVCLPNLTWTEEQINEAKNQIDLAREKYEDSNFHIYGVTHKFNPNLSRKLPNRCEVTPLAGLTFTADGWCYICCDKRGDIDGRMCRWEDIFDFWGSDNHEYMIEKLDPQKQCTRRCTFVGYQEILDKVFRQDRMFKDFL